MSRLFLNLRKPLVGRPVSISFSLSSFIQPRQLVLQLADMLPKFECFTAVAVGITVSEHTTSAELISKLVKFCPQFLVFLFQSEHLSNILYTGCFANRIEFLL